MSAATASTSSLYRKYRPQSFDSDELVGQEHIVRTLQNAVRLDRVAHAYLFCGPRGTGKTTTARLLAKAINCLQDDPSLRPCNACANCVAINAGASPDIIEIDAASNRGIDDIRDLRERVRYAPAQLRSKVYIIDEAHQITGAAANAFLKTLEEPPAHTRFILATTDPEELLPTIVSRCQRFDFRRVSSTTSFAGCGPSPHSRASRSRPMHFDLSHVMPPAACVTHSVCSSGWHWVRLYRVRNQIPPRSLSRTSPRRLA